MNPLNVIGFKYTQSMVGRKGGENLYLTSFGDPIDYFQSQRLSIATTCIYIVHFATTHKLLYVFN